MGALAVPIWLATLAVHLFNPQQAAVAEQLYQILQLSTPAAKVDRRAGQPQLRVAAEQPGPLVPARGATALPVTPQSVVRVGAVGAPNFLAQAGMAAMAASPEGAVAEAVVEQQAGLAVTERLAAL